MKNRNVCFLDKLPYELSLTMKSTLALAGLVAFAAGTPRPLQVDEYSSSALDKRSYLCADGQVTELKDYIVTNERSDVEGSQCTTVQGQGPDFAHWYTEWSWSGSKSVQKTFASAETRRKGNIPISKFGKMPTIWDWRYVQTWRPLAKCSAPLTPIISPVMRTRRR